MTDSHAAATPSQRLNRVRDIMEARELDTLMVLVQENRRYLSGFTGEDGQFDESAGALLITPSRLVLATDSRYVLQAQAEAPPFEIFRYPQSLQRSLPQILKDLNSRRLGFEGNRLSYQKYQGIRSELKDRDCRVDLVAVENLVETLRQVKDGAEVDATRSALRIAERVFERVGASLRPGLREKDVAWELEKGMRDAGAEGLAFPVIVAAGPNSALPHAIPGNRPIQAGEPILFDWGARLAGYCSDTSRTLVLGRPDATFKKVYAVVRDAQRLAIDAIRAGVQAGDVDAVARRYIATQGFGHRFGHGLGHGTGLAAHESPRLSPGSDHVLRVGMIVTVEPGIYIPGWGGVRLENQLVVREDGAENLTRLGFWEDADPA